MKLNRRTSSENVGREQSCTMYFQSIYILLRALLANDHVFVAFVSTY